MLNQKPILISGASFVGAVLAIDLCQKGIPTTLLDKEDVLGLPYHDIDGRSIAISYASALYLKNLKIWGKIKGPIQPIKEIRVFESNSPWILYYEPEHLKDPSIQEMGYMVDAASLKKAVYSTLKECIGPHLTFLKKTCINHFEVKGPYVSLTYDSGLTSQTPLLIAAEGKGSKIRDQQGFGLVRTRYDQTSLVFNISHVQPHDSVAWEIFTPSGPFATLPLLDQDEKHRSGVVWSCDTKLASELMTLNDEDLALRVSSIFPYNGAIKVDSKRWSYPLTAHITRNFYHDRIALVGDAGHMLHPVAGQGVNLGWRDAKVLAEVLQKAHSLGLDLGSTQVLSNYNKSRIKDNWAGFLFTDGIVRLFSNQSKVLGFFRNTGFAVINQIPPLKRTLMKRAMGII